MKILSTCLVVFFLLCLTSCGKPKVSVGQPAGFDESVDTETLSDGIMSWARDTARVEGVKILKRNFPNLDVHSRTAWLVEPKQVLFKGSDVDAWFFVFESEDKYYIKFVMDQFKQVSNLDAGRAE